MPSKTPTPHGNDKERITVVEETCANVAVELRAVRLGVVASPVRSARGLVSWTEDEKHT